ncbi:MAG: hypothetical protein ACLP6E_00830 [Acidimicrobiales bacterium]
MTPTSTVSEEPQAPDPLGRRSLYWATGGAVGDRAHKRGRDTIPLGKHALYSQAQVDRSDAKASERVPGAPPLARVGIRGSDALGVVVLDCSRCGARSKVGMGKFITLHFPVWLWRPGRGYARLMTCPACRTRSWLSASWRPWER